MIENRGVLSRIAPPPDHTAHFSMRPDNVIDFWFARTPDAPLIVLWHGGFWRAAYDRIHIRPLASALRDAGFAVATPEYRRTGSGIHWTEGGGWGESSGGWPGTFDDVALLARHLSSNLEHAGLRPRTILYAGHSAGGHLAVWASRRHLLPPGSPWYAGDPPPIAGVLALAPVLDLAEAFRLDLDEGAVHTLLGGSPEAFPARYDLSDPMRIGGHEPPVSILHGDADGRVPIDLSRRYAAAGFGILEELPGADHFAVIDPESMAWPHVLRALQRLAAAETSFVDKEERR